MSDAQKLYIVKRSTGNCEIVPSEKAEGDNSEIIEKWGPFDSREDALARRVGLIRAGKCLPQ